MNVDAVNNILFRNEPWNALPEHIWPELWLATRLVSIPKHHVLFHHKEQGRAVFFVAEGLLKLSKSCREGRETVIFLAQTGDTVGEQILGTAGCYTCRAQTITDSVLAEIDAEWIASIAEQYPVFGWMWCRFLLERLRKSEERQLNYRFNLTQQRIGLFLKDVAHYYGRTLVNGEIEFRLPMTHELIGEMVGVSRQQVTTIFNQWAKEGIIQYSRRRILLRKPEQL